MTSPFPTAPADDETHRFWMQRCLTLARQGLGRTAPNPMVGCAIVRDGEAVGEGFHPKAGEPHAEVFALRAAGDRAFGATLYVSLEPCNHYGRTPPCSEAVIQAGVARVVVGMVDPDPRVSGGGIERLRAAGIEVIVGVEERACRDLNEAFIHRIVRQRPFGILKYAMTLDGKIATTSGHSAWVSSPEARAYVHRLRSHSDAIIVGTNTLRRDNPHLTSHQPEDGSVSVHNPLRVVMSRSFDLPEQARLWQTQIAPTVVLTQGDPNPERLAQLRDRQVEVAILPALTPKAAMEYLYQRGCSTVLWECGGTLSAQAIAQGCVQKVLAFIAPKVIGGQTAPSPVGDLGLTQMTDALALERLSVERVGQDYLLSGYLPETA
ncbi:bifunctional diaminohydroxyphosphoribosylaminopyrimidine deaminase/5-amino-6-(5-phosphoribosylamino)uracil reductase RibD [Altericista sp. CCNU0014]|uniref:bifunctional diaminohydroxyphosphoribosylaminopyrimidine deaminase/5-amino-6-(5-phosphoribosylamino)uracil reductase RibD n=1 Tax=Altericista sp. CCNU0014 TaxID=3082949 RepID=UPI00384E7321